MLGHRHFIPTVLVVATVAGLYLFGEMPEQTVYLAVPAAVGMGIVFQYDHRNHGVAHALFTMIISGVIAAAVLLAVLFVQDPESVSELVETVQEREWRDWMPELPD